MNQGPELSSGVPDGEPSVPVEKIPIPLSGKIVLALITLVAVAIAGFGWYSAVTMPDKPVLEPPATVSVPTDVPAAAPASFPLPRGVTAPGRGYVEGNPDAPAIVQVWSGLQCEPCGRFELDGARPLRDAAKAGTASVEYLYGPIVGPGSELAANALGCAADQGRFHEFRTLMLKHQPSKAEQDAGAPGFTAQNMTDWGQHLQLPDPAAYNECVRTGRYLPYVESVIQTMVTHGLNYSPTVVVNGRSVFGEHIPFWDFLTMLGLPAKGYVNPNASTQKGGWFQCGDLADLVTARERGLGT
jgi:protein-disulfide isomerase